MGISYHCQHTPVSARRPCSWSVGSSRDCQGSVVASSIRDDQRALTSAAAPDFESMQRYPVKHSGLAVRTNWGPERLKSVRSVGELCRSVGLGFLYEEKRKNCLTLWLVMLTFIQMTSLSEFWVAAAWPSGTIRCLNNDILEPKSVILALLEAVLGVLVLFGEMSESQERKSVVLKSTRDQIMGLFSHLSSCCPNIEKLKSWWLLETNLWACFRWSAETFISVELQCVDVLLVMSFIMSFSLKKCLSKCWELLNYQSLP